MAGKMACYKCTHRGEVAGSAHSKCDHPDVRMALDKPAYQVVATFASAGKTPPVLLAGTKLHIKCNELGLAQGFFNWPWNFDPVWLENCDGFEAKAGPDPEG